MNGPVHDHEKPVLLLRRRQAIYVWSEHRNFRRAVRFDPKVGQIGKKWDKPVFFRYNFILTSTTSTAWETGDRRHFGMGVRFEPKVGHIGPKKDKPEKFYIIF